MLGKVDFMDKKYWSKDPEPGFSEKRNKQIIADSIKAYEKMRAKKMAEFKDGLGERSEAVASFFKSNMAYAKVTDSRIERYFGKKFLSHLQGKDGVERIKNRLGTVFGGSPMPNMVSKKGKVRGKKISDVRAKTKKRTKKG